jgi:hypothetical protein
MAQKNKTRKPKPAASKSKAAKPKRKKAAARKTSFELSTDRFNLGDKSITIAGNFSNADNNNVLLDVYRPNPDPYDFSRSFPGNFSQPVDQLVSGDGYNVDVTVTNTGTFDLTISGDFVGSPITDTVTDLFKRLGYVVVIN